MDNATKDLVADMIESGQGAITGRARTWLNSQVAQALATALAEREGDRAEIARLRLDVAAQEALQDSAYRAGMKAGWNFCFDDDQAGYAKAMEGTEHIAELKRIRELRATLSDSTQ